MASAKKQTKPQSKNTKISLPVILLLCVAFVVLAFGTYKLLRHHQPQVQPITTNLPVNTTQTRIDTGEGSYAVSTNIPHQMRFVSPKLGISFLYLSKFANTVVLAKEEGDKVYIYPDNHYSGYDYHQEPYLQVFQKGSQDSLATAIQKTILQGYASQDCFVTKTVPYAPYSTEYETAIIDIPRSNSQVTTYQAYQKCPSAYTRFSGTEYFAMDKNHPTMFAFFKIGTSNIPSGSDNKDWDATLQFLK